MTVAEKKNKFNLLKEEKEHEQFINSLVDIIRKYGMEFIKE